MRLTFPRNYWLRFTLIRTSGAYRVRSRRAPRVTDRMSATEIDGRLQGWSDRRKNRASTSVG